MYKYNNDMYSVFSDVFRSVLDKHAPIKGKWLEEIKDFYDKATK